MARETGCGAMSPSSCSYFQSFRADELQATGNTDYLPTNKRTYMNGGTSPPFVFVLMPFAQAFRDVYELGIKGACRVLEARCERMDEQFHDGIILAKIYDQIRQADVIVSDMTGRNPNVFYETGYAHAVEKRVILLTQNANDIPFDLQQYQHIVYGHSITDLRDQLVEKLEWAISHPKEVTTPAQDFSKKGMHRTSNSFWLGHDLMWVTEVAADPNTSPRYLWYGVRLCMEHAELLGLDDNTMVYSRLQSQERVLRASKEASPTSLSQVARDGVIKAVRDAINGFGSDLTRFQGTYLRPIDPELLEIWEELKATGEGDLRF